MQLIIGATFLLFFIDGMMKESQPRKRDWIQEHIEKKINDRE